MNREEWTPIQSKLMLSLSPSNQIQEIYFKAYKLVYPSFILVKKIEWGYRQKEVWTSGLYALYYALDKDVVKDVVKDYAKDYVRFPNNEEHDEDHDREGHNRDHDAENTAILRVVHSGPPAFYEACLVSLSLTEALPSGMPLEETPARPFLKKDITQDDRKVIQDYKRKLIEDLNYKSARLNDLLLDDIITR